jgi:hypothetical protein
LALRLIASLADGTTRIYTFRNALHTWICNESEVHQSEHTSLSNPIYAAVVDSWGRSTIPDGQSLQSLLHSANPDHMQAADLHSLLLVAGQQSVSAITNSTGSRFAKFETQTPILAAQIVTRENSVILVIVTQDDTVIALDLPTLTEAYRSRLDSTRPISGAPNAVSLTNEGDYVTWSKGCLVQSTVFDFNRYAFPPKVDLSHAERSLLESPLAADVTTTVSSWFGSYFMMTATALDELCTLISRSKLRIPNLSPQWAVLIDQSQNRKHRCFLQRQSQMDPSFQLRTRRHGSQCLNSSPERKKVVYAMGQKPDRREQKCREQMKL